MKWAIKNRERKRFNNARYMARRKNAEGSHTYEEWLKLKKKYNYKCVSCGSKEPFVGQKTEFLTEDHIQPLTKGGSDYIDNIQPMCFSCNCKKYNLIKNNN